MAFQLLEDSKSLTTLMVPLAAIVGGAVDKLLERFTVTTFKGGEGMYATLIEPIHVDDAIGLLFFGVLSLVGYKVKNTLVLLFGLGGLAALIANEAKEAIDYYIPMK